MTESDIERMTREAGATVYKNRHFKTEPATAFDVAALARFAGLVRAQALEDAANVAEDQSQEYEQHTGQPLNLAYQCAAAIRAIAGDAK